MSDSFVLLHGLTYDHRQFGPLVRELTAMAPGCPIRALDLPGHGAAPPREEYRLAGVAAAVHDQVPPGTTPVLVGHSIGAVLATAYAARYPVRAVLNLDQPLLTGPFGAAVRTAEPVLRSPRWRQVWDGFVAGMGVTGLPPAARDLVETATDPRQDLLLGYWAEILDSTDEELTAAREAELRELRDRGVGYHWVTGSEPPAAYRRWLVAALPAAEITVLPGGHFPHLAYPADVARIALACTGVRGGEPAGR
ncbi:alpha/beta fold hydrolase [Jidongwangia harbinensis]|uniref:alpha/beta fold hydrolase n=1 Tax=Jidongwangia harbinensis TaxID=2878561 RepID=UPI001CD9BAB3|nr:alpha/beta hydrolase [Jidongwangia harbinensis]MCA2211572.1 alpha/beta hydrolase [Jidongwangia harbinensis]